MLSADELVVFQFIDAINAGSVDWLADLMADDHPFVDSAGASTAGKAACLAAWRRFFVAFPDYENVTDRMESRRDVVIMVGRSCCSSPELNGPAIWSARMADGLVLEWRVYDDTPRTRRMLGVDVVAELPARLVDAPSDAER
jgi:ketosteroid isomerase-like protein